MSGSNGSHLTSVKNALWDSGLLVNCLGSKGYILLDVATRESSMAGDQEAGKSTERLEGKGAGERSLDAPDVQESRAAGKKTISEIGKTNPDNWQSKEGHFALIDGSADGKILASRDVDGEVPDKPEDSKSFTSQLAAITEQGDSEKATVAKNLVDMRNNAKQQGLPTTEIDKFAKETLLNPSGGIAYTESQHDAGTFKAIDPSGPIIAPNDRTSDLSESGSETRLDASRTVTDSIATGWKGPRYSFNPIHRDVKPEQKYRLKPEDSYDTIARAQLGPGATDSELNTYMSEIDELNGYLGQPAPYRTPEGEFTRLPGHNKAGDLVFEGMDGNRMSFKLSGVEEYADSDGTVATVRRTKDGGLMEEQKGPASENNYAIFIEADGKAFEKTADGNWETIEDPKTDIRVQRLRLTDSAFEKMPLKEVQDLRQDCKALENRFGDFLAGWMAPEERVSSELVKSNKLISQKEVARTLSIAADMLLSPGDRLPEMEGDTQRSYRSRLVCQAIHHAADPTSVDQGSQPVCGIAALEARVYSRNPSAALKLISEIALTGKFELRHPQKETIDLNNPDDPSLKPDKEAKEYEIDKNKGSACRSHASQLFAVAAINIGLVNRGSVYRFVNTTSPLEGHEPRRGYYYPKESVTDFSKYIDLKDANSADSKVGVSDVEEIGIYQQITGKEERYFYLVPGEGNSSTHLREDGRARLWQSGELKGMLKKLEFLNLLPAIASVDSTVSPIIDQWRKSGMKGTPYGLHAISVPGISEDGSRVAVDNFWGKLADSVEPDKMTGKLQVPTTQLGSCIISGSGAVVDSSQRPGAIPKSLEPCDWRTYFEVQIEK